MIPNNNDQSMNQTIQNVQNGNIQAGENVQQQNLTEAQLTEILRQPIQQLVTFFNTAYFGNASSVKISWFLLSLYLENLVAYNLFEHSLITITATQHRPTLLSLLHPFKVYSSQGKFIKRSDFPSIAKEAQLPIPIAQIIIVGQIFFTSIESVESFLKSLKLFSRSLISEKQVLEWCSSLLPNLSKFLYYSIVDERRESLDPFNLQQFFVSLPQKMKILAYSPNLQTAFSKFTKEKTISIYEDLLEYSSSSPEDRVSEIKLEILDVRSFSYYTAYVDNLTFVDVPSKSMTTICKSLYGTDESPLFGTKLFGERCKQVGKKEHARYLEQFSTHLMITDKFDCEYRSTYIKMNSCKTLERTLFYFGFQTEIFQEFSEILSQLTTFSESIDEITTEIKRIMLFKDETVYSSIRFATLYILLLELYKIVKEDTATNMNKLIMAMKTEKPPFSSYGDSLLANADVLVMGIMRSVKHFQEKFNNYGSACQTLKNRMIAKIQIKNKNIKISLVENLIVDTNTK
ncbi:hypothetical protein TVAG_166410 [Trichomonas vaginalis G3]|uniref:Uncharacterized protein n=1 Tax=Trichomonas vaginalis (strain ATCC PRA-98 / G3) TaxID=412133 RepID=A2DE48_TRIV3|nr:hypothetical protein TVAGG3_0174490 [Trichomonas vaginalis G3]EAY21266.1 hypothetical protein TVAG_166410 [Trichomonas vaginalis G3]KAI5548840.1 hypothetical protein TVAGG3_0174490 [Trichomonas vaginalis G3]|eukprot:XP_001582252.1 hypothetical protein [Trichomonas vaginalis G3]